MPLLYFPRKTINVDTSNLKGNYTFSKDICKSISDTFTRHSLSIDEVF